MQNVRCFIGVIHVASLADFNAMMVYNNDVGVDFTVWEPGMLRSLCAPLLTVPNEGPLCTKKIRLCQNDAHRDMVSSLVMTVIHQNRRLLFQIEAAESVALTVAAEVGSLTGSPLGVVAFMTEYSLTRQTGVFQFIFGIPELTVARLHGGRLDGVTRADLPLLGELCISSCELSNSGWLAMCQVAGASPLKLLTLTSLHLESAKIDLLAAAITHNTTLTRMSVEECTIPSNGAARLVRATAHLEKMEMHFGGVYITDAVATEMALYLRSRAHPCSLQIYGSRLTDTGLADLLGVAIVCNKLKQLCVSCAAGPRSAALIWELARRNGSTIKYLGCGMDNFVIDHVRVLPDLLNSTYFRVNLGVPTAHAVAKHYLVDITKRALWRDLSQARLWGGHSDGDVGYPDQFSPDGDTNDDDKDRGKRPCAVAHGYAMPDLNNLLARRAFVTPALHSLAIGQTDMSRGFPMILRELPLRRLALMNCSVGDYISKGGHSGFQ